MTEQSFIQRRNHIWNEFSVLVRGNKKELKKGAVKFVNRYREITQDLNTAKANGYDPVIIERLNALVNEGNQILYSQYTFPFKNFFNFITKTFPQKVRSQWKGILASMLLFYGIMFFFGIMCVYFPDISGDLLPNDELSSMEHMYNPESSLYLTPPNVSGNADMFGYYIYNNISIAFRTFASGIFAGFGSLLLLCFNAGIFGIIGGYLISIGYAKTFIPFVIAHGAFELTAIVFFAHAGLLLGYNFFITKGLSRAASIKKAGQDALPIIAGSTLMLVLAAAIEAFWSSNYHYPIQLRIGAGIVCWVLVLLYFLFAGRNSAKSETGENL